MSIHDAGQPLRRLLTRLARCDSEIQQAIAEGKRNHTTADHLGILLWELDWRAEKESILADIKLLRGILLTVNSGELATDNDN